MSRSSAIRGVALALGGALLLAGCGIGTAGVSAGGADPGARCGPGTVAAPRGNPAPVAEPPKPELPVTVRSADGRDVTVRDAGPKLGLSGFRPLTSEGLINAAPDVLLVMTAGLKSVGGVSGLLKLPGVAQTPAGRNRRVVDVDDGSLLSPTGLVTTLLVNAVASALLGPLMFAAGNDALRAITSWNLGSLAGAR